MSTYVTLGGLALVLVAFRANAVDVLTTGGQVLHLALAVAFAVAFPTIPFLLWREERAGRGPARARRVAAAVASFAFLLLAIESLARAFPVYDSMGRNPGTAYMWPEYDLEPNELGYKDRSPGPKRGPRVLILGDSFAEGAGVRRPERFSAVLEQLYQKSDPGLEVYNAGHSGMDTADQAEVLIATGDRIEPDVIAIGYVLNDADGQGRRPQPDAPADSDSWQRRAAELENFLLETFGSYAHYRIASERLRRANEVGLRDLIVAQHAEGSPGWALVDQSLDRITAWARERDVMVVLVALPFFADDSQDYRGVMDRVVAEAQAKGIRARSALDDFGASPAALAVGEFDAHPGAEAHRVIAEELRGFIGRPWSASASPRDDEPVQATLGARS